MAKNKLTADEVLDNPLDAPLGASVVSGADELEYMRRKLDEAESRVAEAEERARAAEEAAEAAKGGGLKTNAKSEAYVGPSGGYRFRVGPKFPSEWQGLETVEVQAVDGSEAKRWYCESYAWPPGSRKQVDPVKIVIDVVCLETKKMLALIAFKQRCAGIRSRLESGAALTESEVRFLEQHEAEIRQYEV